MRERQISSTFTAIAFGMLVTACASVEKGSKQQQQSPLHTKQDLDRDAVLSHFLNQDVFKNEKERGLTNDLLVLLLGSMDYNNDNRISKSVEQEAANHKSLALYIARDVAIVVSSEDNRAEKLTFERGRNGGGKITLSQELTFGEAQDILQNFFTLRGAPYLDIRPKSGGNNDNKPMKDFN